MGKFEVTEKATHQDFKKKCTDPLEKGLISLTSALGISEKNMEGAEAAAMHMGEEVEKKNKKKEMPKDSDDLEEDVKGTGLEDDKEVEKELEKETSDGRMQKANTSNEVMKNAIVHVMELKSLIGSKMEKMNEMKEKKGSIGQMMKMG